MSHVLISAVKTRDILFKGNNVAQENIFGTGRVTPMDHRCVAFRSSALLIAAEERHVEKENV